MADDERVSGVKISTFPVASEIESSDLVTGLHNRVNTNFSLSAILAWFRSTVEAFYIPASAKGSRNGVATLNQTGVVPSDQLDLSNKQDVIAVSGILMGNGTGGVSAATPGTDYGTYSKPSGGIPSSDMASAVQTSLGKADTAYQKPSGGIPSSDMTSGVQTSLGKADTAYQKPSGGIPASDLASGVIPTVPSAYTSNPEMDGTASPGSTGVWADGGHVHPSDTSRIALVEKGAANGVASLDSMGKVPSSQLPPIASTAADVTYDNTQSGLSADDVQDAIDELAQGGGGGTTVIANPSGEATESLGKIQVGQTIYSIPSASIFSDFVGIVSIGNIGTVTFPSTGYYAVVAAIDGRSTSTISYTLTGGTVVKEDTKSADVSIYGSRVLCLVIHISGSGSLTVSGTQASRSVMTVVYLTDRVRDFSNITMVCGKDATATATLPNGTDVCRFFAAGTTGDNGTSVTITSDNSLKLNNSATSPVKLHKCGIYQGTESVTASAAGTSYATNYAALFTFTY